MAHYLAKPDSIHLGSWDLWRDEEDNYIELDAIITHIILGKSKVMGKDKEVMQAFFKDIRLKPMILNITNRKSIFLVTKTKNISNWRNIPITIFVEKNIKSPQGLVDALRLKRQVISQQQQQANQEEYNKSITFSAKLLKDCNSLKELQEVYMQLSNRNDPQIQKVKDEMKEGFNID